ncbi:MAG: 30S ribosomal protein S8 [Deltaproteobacteria bacterium]|nr:30S ribosomal protein S8 [Deltaproteobacteria bacterium]MBW2070332.1 30S ribosomal protein S8 [Deltaproteobacteria bacterium]
MVMTDSIADFLTRIRNACMARFDKVDMPSSKMKLNIARVLKEEGYIKNFKLIKDKRQGILRLYLKYDEHNEPVIEGLQRVSKPSCRVYVRHDKIPYVLNGLGTAILSTSRGIITDREARKQKLGGELLCKIW